MLLKRTRLSKRHKLEIISLLQSVFPSLCFVWELRTVYCSEVWCSVYVPGVARGIKFSRSVLYEKSER